MSNGGFPAKTLYNTTWLICYGVQLEQLVRLFDVKTIVSAPMVFCDGPV